MTTPIKSLPPDYALKGIQLPDGSIVKANKLDPALKELAKRADTDHIGKFEWEGSEPVYKPGFENMRDGIATIGELEGHIAAMRDQAESHKDLAKKVASGGHVGPPSCTVDHSAAAARFDEDATRYTQALRNFLRANGK